MVADALNQTLARLAIARSRRHLRAARVLAFFWLPDQAYAHTVLAIEECAVYQIRRQVADGHGSFDKVEADTLGIKWVDEEILTRHPRKQGSFADRATATATLATILGILIALSSGLPESKRKGQSPGGLAILGLMFISAGASMIVPDVEDWERLKQGAFYSGPRKIGDSLPIPPSRKDYVRLYRPARDWIVRAERDANRWHPKTN